jgi:CHAD domain-containing protein
MARPEFAFVCYAVLHDWKAARRRVLRSGATRGAVHTLRISARRLLALEALLAPAGSARRHGLIEAELHAVFRAAGRLRDAQLGEQGLRDLSRTVPEAGRLAAWQNKQQQPLARRLQRALRDLRNRRLGEIIDSWLQPARGDAARILAARSARRLRGRLRWLPAPGMRIDELTPHRLHRLRIHLKQLRYMAELVRAAGCPVPRGISLQQLEVLQHELGAITDLDMQLRLLGRMAADRPSWRSVTRALCRELRRRRAAVVQNLASATAPGQQGELSARQLC